MSNFDDYDNSDNPYAAPDLGGGYDRDLERHVEQPLAGRRQRLGSYFADGLIGIPVAIPLVIGAVMMVSEINPNQNSPLGPVLIGIGLLLLLALFVTQLYFLGRDGQSLGKKMGKCRIVDYNDGSNPGLARIFFLRMLVPGMIGAVPLVGLLFSIADPLFIFGEERRCIHDLIATTKVVEA
jgi:uncharacterized RDD family membrane protein YckC